MFSVIVSPKQMVELEVMLSVGNEYTLIVVMVVSAQEFPPLPIRV